MTRLLHSRGIRVPLLLSSLAWACGNASTQASGPPAKTRDGHRITGPYAHENLAVFLIHGNDRLESRPFMTLAEALAQEKAVVHETGDVNQLAVENRSDVDVYIQAGDIVKGGRQDRMISQDLIVPPRSGKMPIGSFCVEQGRWSRRGQEPAAAFGSAADQVVGGGLKIAARRRADQGEVWKQVAVAQERLRGALGAPVTSPSSASSLQLTLENAKVKEGADRYVTALSPAPTGKGDVVGAAFVVNGRVSSVEIYASRGLFAKLWPRLLKAASIEALGERGNGTAAAAASAASVERWIDQADSAHAEEKELSARVRLVTREADRAVLFEMRDRQQKDAWVHRSYVAK